MIRRAKYPLGLRNYRNRALRDDINHIDHQIFPVIDLARPFLGPDWRPDWIDVDYWRRNQLAS
ncbi:hypothetical protein V5F38_11070 [Xanthobacter sp. V0B-10]|uniref:hypothetical protein n=1 Tax=Xanthobacter albus TaxID=3119929 RepID=UPI00372A3050